ncbi:MAG: tetratricopeptide repeat protein, partial [Victivallales bacterium]|nr:tetratricopeptide repeat protein [Victivallales bacterium]
AATHYADLLALLPQGSPAPGESPDLMTLAPLHRIRALVGAAGSLSAENRPRYLAEALDLYRQLSPLRPENRDAEWGTVAWCLASEYSRGENDADTTLQLLKDAWETLPDSDPHWVEAGMLMAQFLHQKNDEQAKHLLEELRVKCPDSSRYGEFSLQLAEYRKEDNERTRAAEIFDELAQRNDLDTAQRARAAFGAAECLALEGKLDQALAFYRQAAEQADPRQAVTALLHAAQAAKNAGNLETAISLQIETADRFGKTTPDTEENAEARKLRLRAAEARLDAALLRRQDGQPDNLVKAIALLEDFLNDAPDSPRRDEARLERLLMQTSLAANDPERLSAAQTGFQQFAQDTAVEERLRTIAAFECVRLALHQNDSATANRALEEFLTAFPQSPYALRAAHRRVLLTMQSGDSEGARVQATQLIEKWPGSTEAAQLTLLLADFALSESAPEGPLEALRLYRQVCPPAYTSEIELAQARYESANCLYLMAQSPNPEQFQEAIQQEGDTSDDGSTPLQKRLLELALAELAQVPSTAPRNLLPNVTMLRGELLAMLGLPTEAREQFRLVREQSGDSTIGLAALGRMAEMQIAEAGDVEASQTAEKYQEALDAFAYILAHANSDDLLALAHFRTAQCRRELGHLRDAVKNYEDAIRHYKEICVDYEGALTPERSPRYYTLAVFELADLAEELADSGFLEQAAQFLLTYSQHSELPFADTAKERAEQLQKRARN